MGQRRRCWKQHETLIAPSINQRASESETNFADGLASGALRLGKKKTSIQSLIGNKSVVGIQRLGWSPCVLSSCWFLVQDDPQTSCSVVSLPLCFIGLVPMKLK
jgi:hypothetical protein